MQKLTLFLCFLVLAFACTLRGSVILGEPPPAPTDVSGLPVSGPHPKISGGGGFSVNANSREQVREFYNAVYTSSTGVPMNSTAVIASCTPGTNSTAYINATLTRINWYRAMAGIPAAITFNSSECTEDQSAALMMAGQNELQHVGNWTGWDCLSSEGTNAASNSNLALGNDGPSAIDAYILDYGANNYEVGHRRWILYPQTQVMATGDMPSQGSYNDANATWVFDGNYGGPRPATRTPYVAWPPAGYIPYQVVFPQWSFALSNADLSVATVTMSSNGVPVPVSLQSYVVGYGENTLVWYPTNMDPSEDTSFPFGGTDTVYSITISNVNTSAGTQNYSYNVTLFDPNTAGPDYLPLAISGPSQPAVNATNFYSCTISTNPSTTGYQWLVSQTTNGYLLDKALNGITNFTCSPAPAAYPPITNPPVGTGECFHLCHLEPVPQFLQMNEILLPTNTSTLSFSNMLGYASSDETARVQVSTDGGGTWQDIYTETGDNSETDSSFTQHTLSLSNYVGQSVLVRFDYDFSTGSYYPQNSSYIGWCIENIMVTNCLRLMNLVTNATSSTNFAFMPTQATNYLMQARAVIFNQYPVLQSNGKAVSAVIGSPVIMLNAPVISGNQVKISFSLSAGTVSGFHLLQMDHLGGSWVTNSGAVLTTNVPGSSYQFATTNGPPMRFFRVVTP